jgi:hypothetical protein
MRFLLKTLVNQSEYFYKATKEQLKRDYSNVMSQSFWEASKQETLSLCKYTFAEEDFFCTWSSAWRERGCGYPRRRSRAGWRFRALWRLRARSPNDRRQCGRWRDNNPRGRGQRGLCVGGGRGRPPRAALRGLGGRPLGVAQLQVVILLRVH